MSVRYYEPAQIARQLRYLREIGVNQGLRVNGVQIWAGGQPGDSWCVEFVWLVLDICYQGQCPFDRVQSADALRLLAIKNGWVVTVPSVNDIVLSLRPDGTAHHAAIVTNVSPLNAIAGNTSADGTSSNGDRVAEHWVSTAQKLYIHVPFDAPLAVAA
jgi:hypothetical protein